MNKDRKIEIQDKIIHRLEEENKSLLEQNKNLKKMVDDNQKIVEEAERCIKTHNEALSSITKLKERYLQAIADISEYNKNYTKEVKGLIKTIKKNK